MMRVLLILFCYLCIGSVMAEGPQFEVGGDVLCSWTAPIDREDGSRISNALSYNVYHGTSESSMQLIAEAITAQSARIPLVEGQNYCGVVAIEGGPSEGPSRMSALFPFEGVVPLLSRPNPATVESVEPVP